MDVDGFFATALPVINRKATPEFLYEKLGIDDPAQAAKRMIAEAAEAKSSGWLEAAMFLMALSKCADETFLGLLLPLVQQDWHRSHEELGWRLREIGDDRTIPALVIQAVWIPTSAKDDEFRVLAVNAVHALDRLGTPAAVQALRQLTYSPEPLVSDRAKELLADHE